jgi:hypothetical protein
VNILDCDSLWNLVVRDVTGDGIPDIIATTGSDGLYTLVGHGDGTFDVNGPDPSSGSRPSAVATGDVDRDGITDVVAL